MDAVKNRAVFLHCGKDDWETPMALKEGKAYAQVRMRVG